MGCGCQNNNCGCNFAPQPCTPNFPTACSTLPIIPTGSQVVVQDSAFCPSVLSAPTYASILGWNGSAVEWLDGNVNPFTLPNQLVVIGGAVDQLQATNASGNIVAWQGSITDTEAQFPVQLPSSDTIEWGTVENVITNKGVVYKTATTPPAGLNASTVYQVSGVPGQLISFDINGNAIIINASSIQGFIDKQSISLTYASATTITVNFGQIVLRDAINDALLITNVFTYTLNLAASGFVNSLDTGTIAQATYYYVYAIANSTGSLIGCIASLSASSPTLPTGYTFYRFIGMFATDVSSTSISASYNQNGGAVNFGEPANPIIVSQGTSSNLSYSGTITYASTSVVRYANIRVEYTPNGSHAQALGLVIGGTLGTTSTSNYQYPTTSDIYMAMTFNQSTATSGLVDLTVYQTGRAFVPTSGGSYWNVNTLAALSGNDAFVIKITGYDLNI